MKFEDLGLCEDLVRCTFWKVNDAYKAFALELATFPKVPAGTEIRTDEWRKLEDEIGLAAHRRQTPKVLDACLKYEALVQRQFDHLRRLFGPKQVEAKPLAPVKPEVAHADWD